MFALILLKLAATTLEFAAIILLSFSLFRIPYRFIWAKVTLVAFILSCVSVAQEFLKQDSYSLFISVFLYVIFAILVFNLSIFYSLIVCITGYVAYAIIQLLLAATVLFFKLATYETLTASSTIQLIMQLISVLIVALLVIWMQSKKIGFLFVVNRYTSKSAVKGTNLMLSGIIVLSIIVLQLGLLSFNEHASLFFSLVGLIFILLVGLYLTYRKNRKDLIEKYRRLNKL